MSNWALGFYMVKPDSEGYKISTSLAETESGYDVQLEKWYQSGAYTMQTVAYGLGLNDAHLIAAAPDGYNLAQTVEAMIVDGGLTEDQAWAPVLKQCREYMAKTRGEQK